MFNLFHRNCLYSKSIDPHCAYCVHCKPDNEYQGVCEYRGIVAMAGSCRRFEYDALRRKPPKPARIRGRFTADDFYFVEQEDEQPDAPAEEPAHEIPEMPDEPQTASKSPIFTEDLSAFADLWEEDEPETGSADAEQNTKEQAKEAEQDEA